MIYAIFELALGSICVWEERGDEVSLSRSRFHLQLRLKEVIEFPKKFSSLLRHLPHEVK